MKRFAILNKILVYILLTSMLLGFLSDGSASRINGAEGLSQADTIPKGGYPQWDNDGDGTLSILAIGNSFSADALQYAWQIAHNLGIEKIHLGNLYIAGCSLATHAANAKNDSAAYTYYVNTTGTWTKTSGTRMSTGLTSRSWDFVTLQQSPPDSGLANTYNADLTNLIAYVKGKVKNPEATKLAWHMTWTYQKDSTHPGFTNYGKNQSTMYKGIVDAVKKHIVPNPDIDTIIPTGTAIQNLRSTVLGDTVTRDGYHLSYDVGRYTAALMYVKQLTGLSIDNVGWKASGVDGEKRFLAIESVNHAYEKPLAITGSRYSGSTAPGGSFVQITPGYYKYEFWHARGNYHTTRANTTTAPNNAKQYIATNKLSKTGTTAFNYYLPVGSIIVCNEGYQYRPEGWIGEGKQTVDRPDLVDDTYTIVTEEWWGDFTTRAFNISKDDFSEWEGSFGRNDFNNLFRIYIPIEYVAEYYYQLDADYALNTYWNCLNGNTLSNTSSANKDKYFGVCLPESVTVRNPVTGQHETRVIEDRRFTRDILPAGKGVISLRNGYSMRSDGWKENTTVTPSADRPAMTQINMFSTSANWWGEWEARGFNICLDSGNSITGNTVTSMKSYVFRLFLKKTELPCAVELEEQLEIAEQYVDRGNEDGFFPAELYSAFMQCVKEGEALFGNIANMRTVVPCPKDLQALMEQERSLVADKLKEWNTRLADYESETNGVELKHSLNLASDIAINYVVESTILDEYDSCYLECAVPIYEGNERIGTEPVTLQPELRGAYYYFVLNGLTALKMNDMIDATLHMSKDGRRYVSNVDRYSIGTYAYNQLNGKDKPEELKALCANLLRYGAKAQLWKEYRTDALADANMTDAHKAYLNDLDSVVFGSNNRTLTDIEDPVITWGGKALRLDSKIVVRFVMNTTNYTGDLKNLSLHVSFVNIKGEKETVVLTEHTVYDASRNFHVFDFDGLLSAEMRSVLSAAVYEGDTQLSPTMEYSIDTYGKGKTGMLLIVTQAMVAYGDSAKAFFSHTGS